MQLIDTQILSYLYKGIEINTAPILRVSSITASEFLLLQTTNPTKANYYPILPTLHDHMIHAAYPVRKLFFESTKYSARGKHLTDKIILEFKGEYPTVVEYGSLAISQIINARRENLFQTSIRHLDKERQKSLKKRFRFLSRRNIRCVPLVIETAQIGMNLFAQFIECYNPKNNIRNTINDVMILATAFRQKDQLLTRDNLLNKFAANLYKCTVTPFQRDRITLDFSTNPMTPSKTMRESKWYVNRGWSVKQKKQRRI